MEWYCKAPFERFAGILDKVVVRTWLRIREGLKVLDRFPDRPLLASMAAPPWIQLSSEKWGRTDKFISLQT